MVALGSAVFGVHHVWCHFGTPLYIVPLAYIEGLVDASGLLWADFALPSDAIGFFLGVPLAALGFLWFSLGYPGIPLDRFLGFPWALWVACVAPSASLGSKF